MRRSLLSGFAAVDLILEQGHPTYATNLMARMLRMAATSFFSYYNVNLARIVRKRLTRRLMTRLEIAALLRSNSALRRVRRVPMRHPLA